MDGTICFLFTIKLLKILTNKNKPKNAKTFSDNKTSAHLGKWTAAWNMVFLEKRWTSEEFNHVTCVVIGA